MIDAAAIVDVSSLDVREIRATTSLDEANTLLAVGWRLLSVAIEGDSREGQRPNFVVGCPRGTR